MARKQETSLMFEPGLDQLRFIAFTLNDPIQGVELRRLLEAWNESARSLLELWIRQPELQNQMNPGRFFIQPYENGGGKIMIIPNGAGKGAPDSKETALAMFTALMLHPRLQAFGGPCKRCSRYYLRKANRKTVYCSRRCSSTTTAVLHTRARRIQQHRDLLESAARAIDGWKPRPSRRDWKRWVAAEAGVTVKWLTRAVNKHELRAPSGSIASGISHATAPQDTR